MIKEILLVLTLVGSLSAFCQEPPRRPEGNGPEMGSGRGGFALVMDTNKDGKVTKEEVMAWFDKVDTNKDGLLSQEELRASRPRGPGGPPVDRPHRGQRPIPDQK